MMCYPLSPKYRSKRNCNQMREEQTIPRNVKVNWKDDTSNTRISTQPVLNLQRKNKENGSFHGQIDSHRKLLVAVPTNNRNAHNTIGNDLFFVKQDMIPDIHEQ